MIMIGKIVKAIIRRRLRAAVEMFLCINGIRVTQVKERRFEIEPEMITPDLVRMNMNSFRQLSGQVKLEDRLLLPGGYISN